MTTSATTLLHNHGRGGCYDYYSGRKKTKTNMMSSSFSSFPLLSVVRQMTLASLCCFFLSNHFPNTMTFVMADWIDPETPSEYHTIQSLTLTTSNQTMHYTEKLNHTSLTFVDKNLTSQGKVYQLVMSDEFNIPGRTFHDGTDPKWTAIDKNDYTNDALHYYDPQNVRTNDEGELEIISAPEDTFVVGFDDVQFKRSGVTKHFKSGMLQSWNKFCFTGGIIESEVIMPGWHDVGGLWPAFWLLGNLARHTFVGSSAHVWPFSTHRCDYVTSDAQLINGCHNVEHYGLQAGFGRGAPEMDIFEVQPGSIQANHRGFLRSWVGQPFMSASYQVAPGRPDQRPGSGYWPGPGQWYEGMNYGNETCLNVLYYGNYNFFRDDLTPKNDYWSDAVSFNYQLKAEHFETRHVYRLEWQPPKGNNETGYDSGFLAWYVNGDLIWTMNGTSLRDDTNLGTEISTEPSSVLINTAISAQWGFPTGSDCPGGCPCKKFDCNSKKWEESCAFNPGFCDMMSKKPSMKVNWVRVYQDPNDELHKVGCSTPERPTRRYIEANYKSYKREEDTHMLKKIQNGKGKCDPRGSSMVDNCGGFARGTCISSGHICECRDGWTGPNCLVPDGYDPISYDPADTILDLGFGKPSVIPPMLWVTLAVLGGLMTFVIIRRKSMDQWTPVPDVKM